MRRDADQEPSLAEVDGLDHLGVAVTSLDESLRAWKALGLEPSLIEEVPGDRVRVAFLPWGNGRLELLEPSDETSPVARFLAKRGPGLHHVAFRVRHLQETLERLQTAGVPLLDAVPRPGAHGSAVAFLHPSAGAGVLVELVEGAGAADGS